jgi:NADP-dependent 3-hydroxy acid dehydrogenase YdfG
VILGDVNAENGQSVASQDPENILFLEMGVTKADLWNAAIELAFDKFGRFDILVNNAGTSHRNKVCCALEALSAFSRFFLIGCDQRSVVLYL